MSLAIGAPSLRVHGVNDAPVRPDGAYVVYWMIAQRRLGWNFALDHALAHARGLGRPLLIMEALRSDYPYASDRFHRFVLDGMREHVDRLRSTPVGYHPYVEPEPGAGSGLLQAVSEHACVVVTDLWPAFFLPAMVRAAGAKLDVRLEAVDSCGVLPLAAAEKTYSAAFHFRRFLQKTLPDHLVDAPDPDPAFDDLAVFEGLQADILERWPAASRALLDGADGSLASLPIDHAVAPVAARGGTAAARDRLEAFVADGLGRYGHEGNHPDAHATSGLSPWLHWGHLSAYEVFDAVARSEGWSPARLGSTADGSRTGWWGMGESAEIFLDELITWREIGFVYCHLVPHHASWDSLPEWARQTLLEHRADPREHTYTLQDFERADTHDPLWNAAQRQLVDEGVIHGYLRMLWGKKILEWSEDPRAALAVMLELNDRYAVDGRDPNSINGIFWTLGRFDRGWPERPVFGKVRSMSSPRTRKKVELEGWLERHGPGDAG